MKRDPEPVEERDMRPEYDFTPGVRGRYSDRYEEGTNLVRLDPDLAERFPSSEAVNQALRTLLDR